MSEHDKVFYFIVLFFSSVVILGKDWDDEVQGRWATIGIFVLWVCYFHLLKK